MIDIDKCMDWWKNHRAEYKCNMGNRDGTDAEEELINTLYAEVERLRGIIDYIRDTGRSVTHLRNDAGMPNTYDFATGVFLSIMEKVLTTEEYLEWRNKK
jgi:hypothetical protein